MTGSVIKAAILKKIANDQPISYVGRSKWRIGTRIVHVRFRSSAKSKGTIFSYNINPNILAADFELWICANAEVYYLFPIAVMRTIYGDPDTYVDYRHPEIRVAEVDTYSHRLLYGRGGKSMDASKYFQTTFQTSGP
jgi:hypothetical protein